MTNTCFSSEWRDINVEFNGQQVGTHPVKGEDWKISQLGKVEIQLNKGDNVFRLWNDGIFMPDIDKMELNNPPVAKRNKARRSSRQALLVS